MRSTILLTSQSPSFYAAATNQVCDLSGDGAGIQFRNPFGRSISNTKALLVAMAQTRNSLINAIHTDNNQTTIASEMTAFSETKYPASHERVRVLGIREQEEWRWNRRTFWTSSRSCNYWEILYCVITYRFYGMYGLLHGIFIDTLNLSQVVGRFEKSPVLVLLNDNLVREIVNSWAHLKNYKSSEHFFSRSIHCSNYCIF